MNEYRIISFSADNVGAGVSFLAEVPAGAFVLPDSMPSNMAARYALVDGQITDQYPGQDDDAVAAALYEREVLAAEALRGGHDLNDLESVRAMRIAAVRKHFDGVIAALKADVAPYEVETWGVQRDEYARWLADPSAATPYVDGLCAGRGIAKEELMPKIGMKVAGLAGLQGMQHAAEKAIEAAETVEAVLAVSWQH